MQRAGKKKKERKYTEEEMEKYAREVNQRVEQNVLMTIAKCGYTAMMYCLVNPPYNFSKAKAIKFKMNFDRLLISAYKEKEAEELMAELRHDNDIEMLDLFDFNATNLAQCFGPERMKKFFGKRWDDELTMADKRKVHKAWGNYEVK